MLKNNYKSILIHMVTGFLFFVIGIFFISSAKWDSAEAARNHNNFVLIVSIIILLISFCLYYYVGRNILVKQKNTLFDFLSVSSVCIIGLILWTIAYRSGAVNTSNLWTNYFTYNSYSLLLLNSLNITNAFILIIPTFIPSIIMTLGLCQNKLNQEVPQRHTQ